MLNVAGKEAWSYVTNCGNPSAFDVSLGYKECTACCEKLARPFPIPNTIALEFTSTAFLIISGNAQGDCYVQTETDVEKAGINNYSWLAVVVF